MGIHHDWVNGIYYGGIGGYGAFSGNRGGYFIAGLSAGLRLPLSGPLFVDGSVFLGAGGGAAAFPGSGLMLKEQLGIGWDFGDQELVLGASTQSISGQNLGIDWSIGFTQSLDSVTWNPNPPVKTATTPAFKAVSISGLWGFYDPEYPITRTGAPMSNQVLLLGLLFKSEFQKDWYSTLWLMGAGGNGHDGYGKILIGLERYFRGLGPFILAPQLALGMGGGGDIDTGGGTMIQSGFSLYYPLSDTLNAQYYLGYTDSLNGPFDAWIHTLGISWDFDTITAQSTGTDYKIKKSEASLLPFEIQIANKTYIPQSEQVNKLGKPYEDTMQFIGFSISTPLNTNWDILASTYWAWEGNIGAYAEGGFGLRYYPWRQGPYSLFLQSELGVAGGGGVSVGKGSIWLGSLGLRYDLNNNQSIAVQLGQVGGFSSDSFKGDSIQVSFSQHLHMALKP